MVKKCEYPECDRVGALFYFVGPRTKTYVCAQHFDQMSRHYLKQATEYGQEHAQEMVELNGWK